MARQGKKPAASPKREASMIKRVTKSILLVKPDEAVISLTWLEALCAEDRLASVGSDYGDPGWLQDNDVDPKTVPEVPDVLDANGKPWDHKHGTGGTLRLKRSACTYDVPEKLARDVDFNLLECPVDWVEQSWDATGPGDEQLVRHVLGRLVREDGTVKEFEADKKKVTKTIERAARSLLKKIETVIDELPHPDHEGADDPADDGEEE